jgi:hypothetical protein
MRITLASELVTQADTRIVGRGLVRAADNRGAGVGSVRLQKAARLSVLRLRPHHAGIVPFPSRFVPARSWTLGANSVPSQPAKSFIWDASRYRAPRADDLCL